MKMAKHACRIFVCFSVFFVPVSAQSGESRTGVVILGETATLRATGPRVLSEALNVLSRTFNIPLGFEEVTLQDPRDMIDVTSPKYVPKSKSDRAFDPRGGPLELTFHRLSASSSREELQAAIKAILDEYHKRGYPGRYAGEVVGEGRPWIYVYPISAADASGRSVHANAITRNLVNLRIREDEKPIEIMTELVESMGRLAGEKINFGGVGFPQFQAGVTKPAVSSGPAFAVLNAMTSACGRQSWHLLYDPSPSWKQYFLSFRND